MNLENATGTGLSLNNHDCGERKRSVLLCNVNCGTHNTNDGLAAPMNARNGLAACNRSTFRLDTGGITKLAT